MAKPTPKIVSEVCSLCGLDWQLHGTAPTAETCVKLLLDEVTSLNAQLSRRPFVVNNPYPVYPVRPYWPHWYTTLGSNTSATWQSSLANQSPQPLAVKSVA